MFCDAAGNTVSSTATLCDSEAFGILGFTVGAGSKHGLDPCQDKNKMIRKMRNQRKQSAVLCEVSHLRLLLHWMDCSTDHMRHISQPNQFQTL